MLAVLDAESASHQSTKKAMAELAVQRHGQPFGFCWVDGRVFQTVASALGLRQSDVPGVVALSAKRLRFAALPSTGAADVGVFMDGVLSGKVRTEPLDALPKILPGSGGQAGSAAGAGAGAQEAQEEEEVVEEEFDLSDIMAEEVEDIAAADRAAQAEAELEAEAAAAAAAEAAKKATTKSKKAKKSKSKKKGKIEL
ncbi:hypothetical protein FOA52_013521 [Chlamydomonas sp. UWO 241]|nr:hypothetical protein FOA52_013521 [Chlamydomonas sp. UWO 241]